mgnify:CR=1 FL=1
MNKGKVKQIKEIIGYDDSVPEHKRILKRLKKEYQRLPAGSKVNLLEDLKKAFKNKND